LKPRLKSKLVPVKTSQTKGDLHKNFSNADISVKGRLLKMLAGNKVQSRNMSFKNSLTQEINRELMDSKLSIKLSRLGDNAKVVYPSPPKKLTNSLQRPKTGKTRSTSNMLGDLQRSKIVDKIERR
jgi:hypothetical protein